MKIRLSEFAARDNLTDREVAKILGGLLGGLMGMSDIGSIRRAVEWWASTPEAWDALIDAHEEVASVIKPGPVT